MIHIENLTKRFGDHVAVDKLNLDIAAGEFFCYLGPNGAGKTTTIKMLTGLLKPTEGKAVLDRFDIQEQPAFAKSVAGYIPDHPYIYEKLTGHEMMRFVAGLYQMDEKRARERAEELLALFEIDHVADQLVEDYSHGMKQKLSFACCFLHDPKVVIVDEPWVGLDPKNIRFVKDFLREQTKRGVTVFMSTHSLGIIEELADRIGILHHGKLLFTGGIDEVRALAKRPGTLEDVFLEITAGGAAV